MILKSKKKRIGVSLRESRKLSSLGPFYHDWWEFGLSVKQKEGIFKTNQESKEHLIRGYLELAIAKSRKNLSYHPSILETFCADGYYSFWAKRYGAGKIFGIDLDEEEIERANLINQLLGYNDMKFDIMDVNKINKLNKKFDVVLCTGGLYHVSNPKDILTKCHERSKKYLVVQTVITLTTEKEDYFKEPAPGWTWGCRITYKGLIKMLQDTGWDIVDITRNELEGNERLEDRGSVYALCSKK